MYPNDTKIRRKADKLYVKHVNELLTKHKKDISLQDALQGAFAKNIFRAKRMMGMGAGEKDPDDVMRLVKKIRKMRDMPGAGVEDYMKDQFRKFMIGQAWNLIPASSVTMPILSNLIKGYDVLLITSTHSASYCVLMVLQLPKKYH